MKTYSWGEFDMIEMLDTEQPAAFSAEHGEFVSVLDALKIKVQRNALRDAALKLVKCKGRYHTEQSLIELAALVGVALPPTVPSKGSDGGKP